MTFFKALSLALSLGGVLALLPSCGGNSTSDGTDSNTHWLQDCEEDSDCGALSCVCGICTQPCEVGADCAALGSDAVCEVPSSCGKVGSSACVRDGGSGGSSSGGSNAGGSSSGGSSAQGGTEQTLPDPECPAMDAHSGPLSCATVVGYAFDGKVCGPIYCSCEGSDCDRIYLQADTCDSAHKACYAKYGVERSCTKSSDCALRPRTCCAECGEETVSSYIGATRSSPFPQESGLCIGDPSPDRECGKCSPIRNPALYSVCLGGECRPLDMSAYADCETSADCQLVGSNCCDCTSGPGMSLNESVTSLPFCPADCEMCTYEPGQQYGSTCNAEVGKCEMFITTL